MTTGKAADPPHVLSFALRDGCASGFRLECLSHGVDKACAQFTCTCDGDEAQELGCRSNNGGRHPTNENCFLVEWLDAVDADIISGEARIRIPVDDWDGGSEPCVILAGDFDFVALIAEVEWLRRRNQALEDVAEAARLFSDRVCGVDSCTHFMCRLGRALAVCDEMEDASDATP